MLVLPSTIYSSGLGPTPTTGCSEMLVVGRREIEAVIDLESMAPAIE